MLWNQVDALQKGSCPYAPLDEALRYTKRYFILLLLLVLLLLLLLSVILYEIKPNIMLFQNKPRGFIYANGVCEVRQINRDEDCSFFHLEHNDCLQQLLVGNANCDRPYPKN